MVSGLSASASSGDLLEEQILGCHHRPTMDPINHVLARPSGNSGIHESLKTTSVEHGVVGAVSVEIFSATRN